MKHKKLSKYWFSSWVIIAISLLTAACSDLSQNPSSDDGFLPEDPVPSLVDMTLTNGNQLHFIDVNDEEGLSGIFMLESGEPGAQSALAKVEENTGRQANALDVFWAFSEPGTDIPKEILERNNTELQTTSLTQEQGWARELLTENIATANLSTSAADLACNNNSFTSWIKNGFLSNNPWTWLDVTRNKYPGNFVDDCMSLDGWACWGQPRYKTWGQWNSLRNWRGSLCGRAVQNSYNNHYVTWTGNYTCQQGCTSYYGPRLKFQYFWNGQWRHMQSGSSFGSYTIPANATRWYSWAWNTSQSTSYRVFIDRAKAFDEFDLMMDK